MTPSNSNMTLEQFQNLSSEQRKAIPFQVRAEFYAQEFVANLNRNVLAEAEKDQAKMASANPPAVTQKKPT